MKKIIAILCAIVIAAFVFPATSRAQEAKPKRYENVEWKSIVYVEFVTGKRGRALEIIRDHFEKAAKTAGTSSPVRYEMRTGQWDLLIVWTMKEGIESMNWEVSADGIAWRKALNDQEGGAEKAKALLDEYNSLIANIHSEIAMMRK